MKDVFRSSADYELFLYSLLERYPSIRHSTMVFVRRGVSLAHVAGEIIFDYQYRLVVRERVSYSRLPIAIDDYGYEAWRDDEKLYWYDSQPHPHELMLQSTHPHHKHVPPDIKHNRVPAQGLSFSQPNLPLLIEEIEGLVAEWRKQHSSEKS